MGNFTFQILDNLFIICQFTCHLAAIFEMNVLVYIHNEMTFLMIYGTCAICYKSKQTSYVKHFFFNFAKTAVFYFLFAT